MYPRDFTVLLKIRHPDIDPAVLTETFGLAPEHSWKAGDARGEDDAGTTRRESYWVAEVPSRVPAAERLGPKRIVLERKRRVGAPLLPDDFQLDGVLMLTALLFERRKAFWARLQAEGASAQVIVVLGRSALAGFELSHELLSMLSRFGLSVSVDFRDAAEAVA